MDEFDNEFDKRVFFTPWWCEWRVRAAPCTPYRAEPPPCTLSRIQSGAARAAPRPTSDEGTVQASDADLEGAPARVHVSVQR